MAVATLAPVADAPREGSPHGAIQLTPYSARTQLALSGGPARLGLVNGMTVMEVSPDTRRPRTRGAPPNRHEMAEQAWVVGLVLAVVVALDQLSKAWAWRHSADVHVNSGGDMLVKSAVSSWYRSPALGAVFDVADAAVLLIGGALLVRRRRRGAVLSFGALLLAGWVSNLGDRLGLHHLTAPGSIRGVVDFLPWDGRYWNLADLAIVVGTVGFVLAVLVCGFRGLVGRVGRVGRVGLVRPRRLRLLRRPPARSAHPPLLGTRGGTTLAVVVTVTAALAAFGAITYSGVSTSGVFASQNARLAITATPQSSASSPAPPARPRPPHDAVPR